MFSKLSSASAVVALVAIAVFFYGREDPAGQLARRAPAMTQPLFKPDGTSSFCTWASLFHRS